MGSGSMLSLDILKLWKSEIVSGVYVHGRYMYTVGGGSNHRHMISLGDQELPLNFNNLRSFLCILR